MVWDSFWKQNICQQKNILHKHNDTGSTIALSCDTCGIRSTSQIKVANSNAWLQLKSHAEKIRESSAGQLFANRSYACWRLDAREWACPTCKPSQQPQQATMSHTQLGYTICSQCAAQQYTGSPKSKPLRSSKSKSLSEYWTWMDMGDVGGPSSLVQPLQPRNDGPACLCTEST